MRGFKLTVVLAVAACVTGVSASSAMAAAEFTAGPGSAIKGASGSAGEQEFNFGPFQVKCETARATGTVTTEAVYAAVKFGSCMTVDRFGSQLLYLTTSVKEPVNFVYAASGSTAVQPFTIEVKTLKCSISVFPGAGSSSSGAGKVSFNHIGFSEYTTETASTTKLKQFPTGFQQKLRVATEGEEMEASFTGQCGGFAPVATGTYTGDIWYEDIGGNLSHVGAEGESGTPIEIEWNKTKNVEDGA